MIRKIIFWEILKKLPAVRKWKFHNADSCWTLTLCFRESFWFCAYFETCSEWDISALRCDQIRSSTSLESLHSQLRHGPIKFYLKKEESDTILNWTPSFSVTMHFFTWKMGFKKAKIRTCVKLNKSMITKNWWDGQRNIDEVAAINWMRWETRNKDDNISERNHAYSTQSSNKALSGDVNGEDKNQKTINILWKRSMKENIFII